MEEDLVGWLHELTELFRTCLTQFFLAMALPTPATVAAPFNELSLSLSSQNKHYEKP